MELSVRSLPQVDHQFGFPAIVWPFLKRIKTFRSAPDKNVGSEPPQILVPTADWVFFLVLLVLPPVHF